MDGQTSIRRYLSEGVLIVVSILIAFGIDAAWDEWQEGREERRVLQALHAELQTNRSRVGEWTVWHEDVALAIRSLLGEAAEPSPSLSADSIDALLGKASWFNNGSTFQMSAVDAVVLGGKLAIVDSEPLRQRITAWNRQVERVTRTEVQDYDTFSDVWMPFLREHSYLPQIHNAIEVQPGSGDWDYIADVPLGRHAESHRRLLSDRSFQNVLLHRLWVQGDILQMYEEILPGLDSLMAEVAIELGN